MAMITIFFTEENWEKQYQQSNWGCPGTGPGVGVLTQPPGTRWSAEGATSIVVSSSAPKQRSEYWKLLYKDLSTESSYIKI